MTTIDERLEALTAKIEKDVRDDVANHVNGNKTRDACITRYEAKAAMKSLFLDLIAEAKPKYYEERSSLNAIREFENNLKQTIDGGKK